MPSSLLYHQFTLHGFQFLLCRRYLRIHFIYGLSITVFHHLYVLQFRIQWLPYQGHDSAVYIFEPLPPVQLFYFRHREVGVPPLHIFLQLCFLVLDFLVQLLDFIIDLLHSRQHLLLFAPGLGFFGVAGEQLRIEIRLVLLQAVPQYLSFFAVL